MNALEVARAILYADPNLTEPAMLHGQMGPLECRVRRVVTHDGIDVEGKRITSDRIEFRVAEADLRWGNEGTPYRPREGDQLHVCGTIYCVQSAPILDGGAWTLDVDLFHPETSRWI